MTNEPMYCLFSPDGSPQPMFLAPDFPTCVGIIKLAHKKGLSQSFHEITVIKGFKILPCNVSIEVTGDENSAFKKQ